MASSTWCWSAGRSPARLIREWYGHTAGIVPLWIRLGLPWALIAAWLSREGPNFAWLLPLLAAPVSASLYAGVYMAARRIWRIPLHHLKLTDTLLLAGAIIGYTLAASPMATSAVRPLLYLPAAGLFVGAWLHSWHHEAPPVSPGEGRLPAAPLFLVRPASGPVTAGYRSYDRSHTGLDLGLPVGTPVRAPAHGQVVHAGPLEHWGFAVILDHGDGWSTLYAHLERVAVRRGASLEPGATLGWSGTTGISTGPHLHLELRYGGAPVDPAPLLATDR